MKRSSQIAVESFVLLLLILGILGALLAADSHLHRKYADTYGVNHEGYRGIILGPKKANEKRLVILGGSLAFGYGTPVKDSVSSLIENHIRSLANKDYRVINLAFNTERTSSFAQILEDYSYLDYDAVMVLSGGGDFASAFEGGVTLGKRYESWIYRYTGYFPILPINLAEKMMSIRFGGDLQLAYVGGEKKTVVFRAGMSEGMKEAVSEFSNKKVVPPQTKKILPAIVQECDEKWHNYCNSIYRFTEALSSRHVQVVFANEPLSPQLREQEPSVFRMLKQMPGVTFLSLSDHMDREDRSLFYDGSHFNEKGSAIAADILTPYALEALKKAEEDPKRELPNHESFLKALVRKITSFIPV